MTERATPPKLELLLRTRVRSLANAAIEAARESPIRLAAAVVLIGLIWLGLFQLFRFLFLQLQRTPLEATVAVPMVFNFFFLAMLVLLTFSNAILVYGSLFGRAESAYLLTLPMAPLDFVTFKYFESLILSSWSIVLLGLPLMLAMSQAADELQSRGLFLAFFIAFIPIPGALGLLGAWAAARFLPRRATRAAAVLGVVVLFILVILAAQGVRMAATASELWLRSFLARMSFVEGALLPNNWVASGIDHALHGGYAESFLYLGVTVANALFLSWLAVRTVAGRFDAAYDRVQGSRSGAARSPAPASGGPAGWVFAYLPLPLRLIAAKDLRTFLRDPAQWSQLTILVGLLVLYLTNMPALRLQFAGWRMFLLVPYLNLCAVSLILATFTCRFVFPLVSLEGQKLWLVGVLPVRRSRVLIAKFAFAMTVTLGVAISAMGFGAMVLELNRVWTVLHLVVTASICFGLCGFAVGIGARMPMFRQSNPARIANGLGGTVNLLASLALVAAALVGVGVAIYRSGASPITDRPDVGPIVCCAASVALCVAAGSIALYAGARHFNRIEA